MVNITKITDIHKDGSIFQIDTDKGAARFACAWNTQSIYNSAGHLLDPSGAAHKTIIEAIEDFKKDAR